MLRMEHVVVAVADVRHVQELEPTRVGQDPNWVGDPENVQDLQLPGSSSLSCQEYAPAQTNGSSGCRWAYQARAMLSSRKWPKWKYSVPA